MKERYELFLIFIFLLKTNLNLGKELKFLEVTMSNNIFYLTFHLFFLLKDNTILTIVFLINCMPSAFVDHKKPLFMIPCHIFCYTCFVHNVSPRLEKLFARAIECVFLYTPGLKKNIIITSKSKNDTSYLQMSYSLKNILFFSYSLNNSNFVHEVLPISYFVLLESYPPLITYQHREHIVDPPSNEELSESCPS
ncbi:hypothetical protein CR513_49417, partial [Mucuna pruriens]